MARVKKSEQNSLENILKSVIAAVDKEWEIILPEKISASDKKVSKPEPSGGGFFIDDDY